MRGQFWNRWGVLGACLCLTLWAVQNARAEFKTDLVDYVHLGTKLQGYLAYDDSRASPRPAVLLIHEWWGHNDYIEKRARDFANLGYVAFALDMYGKGVKTVSPDEASKLSKPFYEDRELFRGRAKAGLDQLTAQRFVDPNRIVVLGYCFGGTGALELARSGANLKGAISFHGGLASPLPAKAGELKAKIIAFNGAEDPLVKPEERSAFMDEMRAAGADWQFVEFGGAVHAFTNPLADTFKIPALAYNANADKRSLEMAKQFLKETLG